MDYASPLCLLLCYLLLHCLVWGLRVKQVATLETIADGKLKMRCTSRVYCEGPLLGTIQRSNLHHDSKAFVDMPGKYDEETIIRNFDRLGPYPGEEALAGFVASNFYRPGSDLRVVVPKDWKVQPELLAGTRIKDGNLRDLAATIHSKWKALVRVVDPSRVRNDTVTSTIALPYPFVVPGGRFRELYYWDSFWILEGLYVSGMCETAKFVVENLAWLVSKFGFIPNGSRKYYLNRSQPPLFAQICQRFLQECVPADDKGAWIRDKLPLLDQEYEFWMTFRVVRLPLPDGQGTAVLNRYHADTELARPEAFKQDTLLADTLSPPNVSTGVRNLFKQLATGAESGWDFTVRWFGAPPTSNLTQISLTNMIPTDLNAIMYRNEAILGNLHTLADNSQKREYYSANARNRLRGMDAFLKSPVGWSDYDFVGKHSMAEHFDLLCSNLAPLWYGALDTKNLNYTEIQAALLRHGRILFNYPGGIPNNLFASGEQWDFPNVWAPIQYHFINVFEDLGKRAPENQAYWQEQALNVAQRFMQSVYCGFKNYGQFFEKYHAQMVGQPGGGGEYIVQDGFGWTNGVALWIIKKYPDRIKLPDTCPSIVIPAAMHGQLDLGISSSVAFRKRERMERMRSTMINHTAWMVMAIILMILGTLAGITLVSKCEHFGGNLFREGQQQRKTKDDRTFLVLPLQDPYQLEVCSF